MYPPLCGGSWKVKHTRPPPQGAPIPQTAQARPEGLGCIRRCVGGGNGNPYALGPPTGRPYPPNGPSRTTGTRVYPPLCGGKWEGLTHPTPPRGAPIPQTAQGGPEGLGCIRRCVGGELEIQARMAPHGASLSPKRPRQVRGDLGVSATMWRGAGKPVIPDPPTGRPYPPNGPSRTGGTRVSSPLCGEAWKIIRIRPFHGAPLSPNRPRQDRWGSGVSATVWGGLSRCRLCAPTPLPSSGIRDWSTGRL